MCLLFQTPPTPTPLHTHHHSHRTTHRSHSLAHTDSAHQRHRLTASVQAPDGLLHGAGRQVRLGEDCRPGRSDLGHAGLVTASHRGSQPSFALASQSSDIALTSTSRARITDISRLDWRSALSRRDSTPPSASIIRHDQSRAVIHSHARGAFHQNAKTARTDRRTTPLEAWNGC